MLDNPVCELRPASATRLALGLLAAITEQLLGRVVTRPVGHADTHVSITTEDLGMPVTLPGKTETRTRPLRSAAHLTPGLPMQAGRVTVIIPAFNRGTIVGRAIDSALNQTYLDVEVVVVDDGSTDDTRAVVEAFGPRVRYFYQQNCGVSAARNLGMRNASGEFLAFLDSDDVSAPWRLESEVAALLRHPEAGVVWTDMTAVDRSGKVISDRYLRVMYKAHSRVNIEEKMRHVGTLGDLCAAAPREFAVAPVRMGDLFSEILLGNLLHTPTVLVRRTWVEQAGGFDPSFVRTGEDYEYYVRLCSVGPVIFIDAPSTYYCVGASDQLTRPAMLLEIARNNLRAIKKWIPHSAAFITLSPESIRRRFADSYGWIGEAELDAGNRVAAMRVLVLSLMRKPRIDRRSALLVRCALPNGIAGRLRTLRAKFISVPR